MAVFMILLLISLMAWLKSSVHTQSEHKHRAQTPQEACEDTAFYCTLENGKLKHNHAYYHQVQQQLYVSNDTFSWCDFCIYTTKGCLVTRISLDEKWVEENIPKLEAYFEECMLEEIILGCLKPSCYL